MHRSLFANGGIRLLAIVTALLAALIAKPVGAAPTQLSLDYAYYNPLSLLIKERGWLEQELADQDIKVRWTLSQGSNKALEYLRANAIDFGSTAGSAALVARANGLPIRAIYAYSKPEWTALVVRANSDIQSLTDLKGKRVAVTRGTDPHIFLLRALNSVGLAERDITTALLQHPDGYNALARGQVDAWAGLDPHMARAELQDHAKLLYRDINLNTYGLLNVRDDFAKQYPHITEQVLAVYERARLYALEHPKQLAKVLAQAARIDLTVAERQLKRTDLRQPIIGKSHQEVLVETGQVLKDIGILRPNVDVVKTTSALLGSND